MNGDSKTNLKIMNGTHITMIEIKDGDSKRNLNLNKKCEVCGKEIQDPHATHCSDKCLFESIKNTKPFRGLK